MRAGGNEGAGWRAPAWRLALGLVLMATLAGRPALAVDWLLIGDSSNATDSFAVDVDNLEKVPGSRQHLRLWMKRIPFKPESRGLFKPAVTQAIERMYVDCPARTYSMIAATLHGADGALLDTQSFPDPPADMLAAPPSSIAARALATGCLHAYGKAPSKSVSVDPAKLRGANWVRVGNTSDGRTTGFLSDADVEAGEGQYKDIVFQLTRFDFSEPQTLGGARYTSTVSLYMNHCINRTSVRLSVVWYDKNEVMIYRSNRDPAQLSGKDITTLQRGSIGESLTTRACQVAAVKSAARPAPPAASAGEPRDGERAGERGVEGGDRVAERDGGRATERDGGRDTGRGGRSSAGREPGPGDFNGSGTGWHVGNGLIVTAAHVVEGASSIRVVGPNNHLITASVVQQDSKNDVAILSLGSAYGMKSIALARAPAPLGSRVLTIGYPLLSTLGSAPKVTSGEISATQGMANDPTLYQISTPVQAGNSGGPLFNMNGEVVGMVVSKLRAEVMLKSAGDLTQNVNYAVKTRYIEALLEEANRGPLPAGTAVRKELRAEELVAQNRDAVLIILVAGAREK